MTWMVAGQIEWGGVAVGTKTEITAGDPDDHTFGRPIATTEHFWRATVGGRGGSRGPRERNAKPAWQMGRRITIESYLNCAVAILLYAHSLAKNNKGRTFFESDGQYPR